MDRFQASSTDHPRCRMAGVVRGIQRRQHGSGSCASSSVASLFFRAALGLLLLVPMHAPRSYLQQDTRRNAGGISYRLSLPDPSLLACRQLHFLPAYAALHTSTAFATPLFCLAILRQRDTAPALSLHCRQESGVIHRVTTPVLHRPWNILCPAIRPRHRLKRGTPR